MGLTCECITKPDDETTFTILTKSKEKSTNKNLLHIKHNRNTLFTSQNSFENTQRSKRSSNLYDKKKFFEDSLTDFPKLYSLPNTETPKSKIKIFSHAQSSIFKEDLSSLNSLSISLSRNTSQLEQKLNSFQNTFTLSNESIKNVRMIFPVLYINTGISQKLYINKNEIFISFDSLEQLDKDEIVYDCVLILYNKNNLNRLYTQIFQSEMLLFGINEENDNIGEIVIKYSNVISISKNAKDKKNWKKIERIGRNFKFAIKTTTNGKYELEGEWGEIGKAAYEIISFLIWKYRYTNKT